MVFDQSDAPNVSEQETSDGKKPGDEVDAVVVDTDEEQDAAQPLDLLLARCADRDRTAFAALYDRTAARVFALVLRVLRDHAQAEEVTQEVYLEIWQSASRYEPNRGAALPWMITMAHRRAIDRVRASQAGRDRDMRIGVRDWSPDVDVVAEHVEIAIESERVAAALQRLTRLQREAITLAYFGGYSQSEVAGHLQVPIGTVKTRLRDGLIRLRDELGVTQ